MSLRVSVSGVRGVIGDGMDALVAARWTAAFGAWLPPGAVVVGRDSRPSGEMIRHAVVGALMSTGHDVLDIGIASTPTTEIAVTQNEAVGGIIITASHNPQPWNALKFLQRDGLFLTAGENDELRARLESDVRHVAWDRLGRCTRQEGAEHDHLQQIMALPWLDVARIRARGMRVAVDAVEGAGGRIVPELLTQLGVSCVPLHCGLSGLFPHDPEPTPANLQELAAAVKANKADLGVAVDPDVDRLALVAGDGMALSEEMTLVLAVDFLLGYEPGKVVVNLSTTRLIEEVAASHGAAVARTPVGEANVVQAMLAAKAVIGGEGNGGVIYPNLHPGRDALVGIAMILQHLADKEQTLAQLAAALPPVAMVKQKVPAEDLPRGKALAAVLQGLGSGKIDDRDGVKWTGEDAWVHVRASNTEPVVRIIAEASDEDAAQSLIAKVINARSV